MKQPEACMNIPDLSLERPLKQQGISEVECMISDLTGIARGKIASTGRFLEEGGMRLPESVLLQTVTGDFVDDQAFYALLDEAGVDMFCRPAPEAIYVMPWLKEPTALVIHDTFDKFGNPIELSPRNVLKRVLGLYANNGWKPVVAPELEFYLTKRCLDPDLPSRHPTPFGPPGARPAEFLHRCHQRIRAPVRGPLPLVRGAGPGPRHPGP